MKSNFESLGWGVKRYYKSDYTLFVAEGCEWGHLGDGVEKKKPITHKRIIKNQKTLIAQGFHCIAEDRNSTYTMVIFAGF
ncbi:hypothetical protein [Paenibacillus tengchongensis]|uniref:hypothetical protein n=1 Tax=Paenibacillus tengchongensis TaxID=2608684 RepID=UPI00124F1514|nr:hypothetical protein [Paenibacillus tengchongensis]